MFANSMYLQLKATYKKGENVWMKNPTSGYYEWAMTVESVKYDEVRQTYEYELKDGYGFMYNSRVSENNLRS